MSGLRFEPLHRDFGVRVQGVDLTASLSEETVTAIREAVDAHSLLCFPRQAMNDAAHLAFTRRLGAPEAEHVTLGTTGQVVYFGTVGNVAGDGSRQGNAHPRTRYQAGNEVWHSDSSFRRVPSFVSITHAYEVPGEAGETRFASMRAAYARLPEALKTRIEPLHVLHDYVFSRSPVAPVDPNHGPRCPPSSTGWCAGTRPTASELLRRLARALHRGLVGGSRAASSSTTCSGARPGRRTSTPTAGRPVTP